MRVGVDLTVMELDVGGTKRYVEAVSEEFRRAGAFELLEVRHAGRPASGPVSRVARGLSRNLVYYRSTLPRWIERERPDVVFCPTPLGPWRSAAPVVMIVHDMLAWDLPDGIGALNAMQIKFSMRSSLKHVSRVIACSEHTRDRLVALLDFDPARIVVVPLGVDERFAPSPAGEEAAARETAARLLGTDAPFVLTVGPVGTRKNPERVARAVAALADAGLPHLVVSTGLRTAGDEEAIARITGDALRDRFRITGMVSDDELIALYRACDCFVIASLSEGFGLPPLEAMACGAPVLASNRTSIPEVVGDAAPTFDPDDPQELERALVELLQDDALAQSWRSRGAAHAAEFTWRRTADAITRVFEQAAA